MKLMLMIATEGPWKGKGVAATPLPFVIGRDPQCHLRPASNAISQRHCVISVRDGTFYFRDLGSTNGSLLNNRLVKGVEVPLAHGDRLTLGNLLFIVRIDQAATVGGKAPIPRRSTGPDDTPAPHRSLTSEEDAVAAMLLSSSEGESRPGVPPTDEDVPEGPTEVLTPLPDSEEVPRNKSNRPKGKGNKPVEGTTGAVAAELLKNYLRRLRDEADEL